MYVQHTCTHTSLISPRPISLPCRQLQAQALGEMFGRRPCNGSAGLRTYIRTYMHTYVHMYDQKRRAPYINNGKKLHKRLPFLPRFCATSGRLLGTIHFCFLWTAFRRQIWAVHFLWRRSCTSEAVQGSLRRFNKIPNYTVPGEIPNVTQSLIRFLELLDKSQCHFAPFLEDGRWLKPQNAKGVEKGLGVATRAWR